LAPGKKPPHQTLGQVQKLQTKKRGEERENGEKNQRTGELGPWRVEPVAPRPDSPKKSLGSSVRKTG